MIQGSCQSGRKVVTHDYSKSDLPLVKKSFIRLFIDFLGDFINNDLTEKMTGFCKKNPRKLILCSLFLV